MDQLVERFPYPDPRKPDVLTPQGVAIMKQFKKDSKFKHSQYVDDFAWSVKYIDLLSKGAAVPPTKTIMANGRFARAVHPDLDMIQAPVQAAAGSREDDGVEPVNPFRAAAEPDSIGGPRRGLDNMDFPDYDAGHH